MNKWQCDHAGCISTAVGVGSAVGLRAIGWHVTRYHGENLLKAPTLLCPYHWPDQIPCTHDRSRDACGQCAAEHDAEPIQLGLVTLKWNAEVDVLLEARYRPRCHSEAEGTDR